MKIVIAVIEPFKLGEVRDALIRIGVQGMTITEVSGHAPQNGHTETYQSAEYEVTLLPKIMLEVACSSDQVDRVTEAIASEIGDGKIFVMPLDRAVSIRTGEVDAGAL